MPLRTTARQWLTVASRGGRKRTDARGFDSLGLPYKRTPIDGIIAVAHSARCAAQMEKLVAIPGTL
jgi:hypothetical protein